jgi:hypothetical protein
MTDLTAGTSYTISIKAKYGTLESTEVTFAFNAGNIY